MRFSITTVLAFATAAMAQVGGFHPITKPTEGEKVPAGSTYEIVWGKGAAGHPGTIKIGLLGGATPGTLRVIDTLASGVDGEKGSFSWQVGEDLGNLATYGIQITLESDETIFQYGFPFQIVGGSGSGSSTSKTATASGSATSTGTGTATTTGSSKSSTVTSAQSSGSTSSSFSVPSSTIASSTIRSNLTTTSRGSGGQTTITSVVIPTGPSTTTATTSIPTNGVASVAAGSFALFGGVAMAVLAL